MSKKFELQFPKKVNLADISVRDGLQHEEHFIPTDAKVYYVEESILAGFKRLEITNFGNPAFMPQFKDSEELLKRIRGSKRLSRAGINFDEIEITAVAIRESAVDNAIRARKEGWGPDRIGMIGFYGRGAPLGKFGDYSPRVLGGGAKDAFKSATMRKSRFLGQ